MTDLQSLIARLEKATGSSRELDAEIAHAVGWTTRAGEPYPWLSPSGCREIAQPTYTSSTDDALTLVPAGWTVGGLRQNDNKQWTAELREGFATSHSRVVIEPSGDNYRGTTLPMAIVTAALRAIESTQ